MKRLLLPLLAALALPTTVNAESYWLVLIGRQQGTALEKIEMQNMEKCEEQGKIFYDLGAYYYYVCLKGK